MSMLFFCEDYFNNTLLIHRLPMTKINAIKLEYIKLIMELIDTIF